MLKRHVRYKIWSLIILSTLGLSVIPSQNAYAIFGEQILAGSGWLSGYGVPIYSNSYPEYISNDYHYINNQHNQSTQTGMKWQCVELVNRLYMSKGWIDERWTGNGNEMYAKAPSHLTKTPQGSITLNNIRPGDVIGLNSTPDNIYGHVVIVDSINESIITVISQNANTYTTTTLNSNGSMNSILGYSVQGVIHAPGSVSPFTTFQSNTNLLYRHNGTSPDNTSQGMKASTSPSIKKTISSSYYIAFQANTGDLVGYTAANGATSTGQGMTSTSSPSVGVGVVL